MKPNNQYMKIGICCPPCNLCERIKILCLLCGFDNKNIMHTNIDNNDSYSIKILPIQIDNNYYWKVIINLNSTKTSKNKNEYENKNIFPIPKREKEFILLLNEVKNIIFNNENNCNSIQNEKQHDFIKVGYRNKIIVLTSIAQKSNNSFLSIELANFLLSQKQNVCVLDYSLNNEISHLLNLSYTFSINDISQDNNPINLQNFYELSPKFYSPKNKKGIIYISGNIGINSYPRIDMSFIEKIYQKVDYLIINTGYYSNNLQEIYKRFNTILECDNSKINIAQLEEILKTNIDSFSCISTFDKNVKLLEKIAYNTQKPFISFKRKNNDNETYKIYNINKKPKIRIEKWFFSKEEWEIKQSKENEKDNELKYFKSNMALSTKKISGEKFFNKNLNKKISKKYIKHNKNKAFNYICSLA